MTAGSRARRRRQRSRWRLAGDVVLAVGLLIAVAMVAARGIDGASATFEGRFVVVDGDSLTADGERLRLEGIDAPELDQSCASSGRHFDCGRTARDALRALMSQDAVCNGWRRDAYDRLLVRCTAGETDINATMVETGQAVAYGDHEDLEQSARAARRGIWAGDFERPQAWRQRQGRPQEETHGGVMAFFDAMRRWLRL